MLFICKVETARKLPPPGSLPKGLSSPVRLGQGQGQELVMRLPCRLKGLKHLGLTCCLPRCAFAGSWNGRQGWDSNSCVLIQDAGGPSSEKTPARKAHPGRVCSPITLNSVTLFVWWRAWGQSTALTCYYVDEAKSVDGDLGSER